MKKRILLVEDEPMISFAESRILENQNYEVTCALTGEEAVSLFFENPDFDLILIDIDLGEGIDGIETAKRILKKKEVPVVFLSAHTEPEIVAKTEEITSYGYVVKTSGETVLLMSIKMALRLFEAKCALNEKNAALEQANEELQSTLEELESTNEELQGAMEELEVSNEELARSQEEILSREQMIDFERQQLLAIFDTIPDSMYVCDMVTYEVLFVNKTLCEQLGYNPSGKICFNEFQGFNRPCDFCTNDILRKNPNEPYRWEFFNKKLNRYYMLTDCIIAWPDGRKVRLEIARDITELKESLQEAQQYHERLRRAELVSKSGNWEFHLRTKKVFASEGARAIYGLGALEWSIPEVQKIPLPEYRSMLNDALEGLIHEGKPYDVEFKIRRPDSGDIVDIHSIAEYDPENQVVFGIIQDVTERKKIERFIFEHEQMMRNLLNASYESMYLLKIDGTIEMTNEIGAAKLGLLPDEAKGKNIFAFFEDGVREYRSAMLQKASKEGAPIRFIDKQNSGVFENSLYPVIDNNGVVQYIAVFAADITEKKRIEDELIKSEAKYRAIVEHAGEAIVIAFGGKLVYVNQKTVELLGYDAEYLYSRPFVELIHPDDREMVFANYTRRITGEPTPSMYEFRVIHRTGEVRHVLIRPAVIPWEGGFATVNMLTDVTDRKKLYEMIKSQLQFLENLLEAIPYPVFYKDTQGRYLGCNRAFADFLGIPAADIVGKTVFDIAPRERADVYYKADAILLQNPGQQHYESKVGTSKGELRDVIFHKATFYLRDGSLGGIIGTIIDITEQKKAEEKLLYATQIADINRERAEKLLGEKEMLLKEVHHRIKNNLSTIMGLLSLQAQSLNNEEARAALSDARNRIQSMVVLYDKLYTTKYYKSIPLSEYLKYLVYEIVSLYPHGNKIQMKISIPQTELPIKRIMPLGIIVNELITNSMKYAFQDKGGGTISIEGYEENGKLTISISDDGPGIPPEVFKGNSKGFGLELVTLLAKQLKGNLQILPEEGAKFIIEFYKD